MCGPAGCTNASPGLNAALDAASAACRLHDQLRGVGLGVGLDRDDRVGGVGVPAGLPVGMQLRADDRDIDRPTRLELHVRAVVVDVKRLGRATGGEEALKTLVVGKGHAVQRRRLR